MLHVVYLTLNQAKSLSRSSLVGSVREKTNSVLIVNTATNLIVFEHESQ